MNRLALLLTVVCMDPLQTPAPITAAAFAPDGTNVVLGSQGGVQIRSWPELKVTKTLSADLVNIHDLSFAPDGKSLLIAGGTPADAGLVEILGWPNGKPIRRIGGHRDVVYCVAWSPDGTQWVTASADGRCQVFSSSSGERLACYEGHSRAVLAVAYLPDGKTIASAGVDQTLRLWDGATGKHVRTLDNHVDAVNGLAVRPTGVDSPLPIVVTVSEDRTVRIWQPSIGRLMRFARLPSIPRAVAWSAKGNHLYVGCNDGQVRILDFTTMEIVKSIEGLDGRIHELLVDPSTQRLLAAGQSGVRQLELE